jgi:hypothetical protein
MTESRRKDSEVEGKEALLFEKKKQKTFPRWSPSGRSGLQGEKSFGSFLQKRTAFFFLEELPQQRVKAAGD